MRTAWMMLIVGAFTSNACSPATTECAAECTSPDAGTPEAPVEVSDSGSDAGTSDSGTSPTGDAGAPSDGGVSDGGSIAGNGNVFVAPFGNDASAGCRRYQAAVAAPQSLDAGCATFARAYQLAAPGDAVLILPGAYPAQSLSRADPSKDTASLPVVFEPAGGDVLVNGDLRIQNTSNLTLRSASASRMNFKVRKVYVGTDPFGPLNESESVAPHNVRLENLDGEAFQILGATFVNVEGGDWGPSYACSPDASLGQPGVSGGIVTAANLCPTSGPAAFYKPYGNTGGYNVKVGGGSSQFLTHDIVIRGTNIHDMNSYDLFNLHDGGPFIITGYNLRFERNRIDRVVVYGMQVQNFPGYDVASNVVMTNNFWGRIISGVPGQETVVGAAGPQLNTNRLRAPVQKTPQVNGGGSLQAGSYCYVVTRVDDQGGETDAIDFNGNNNRRCVTVPVGSAVIVSWEKTTRTQAAYRIYRGPSGSETLLSTTQPTASSFTDTGVVAPGAATVPTANTSLGPYVDWLFAYNSFLPGGAPAFLTNGGVAASTRASLRNVRFVGNLFGDAFGNGSGGFDCYTDRATVDRNGFVAAPNDRSCGTSVLKLGTSPYVDPINADLHLSANAATSPNGPIDYLGTLSSDFAVADDIDGEARPRGAARDLGADER